MSAIPILLLKTRSIPADSYEEFFATPASPFIPSFVPVLEHQPSEENLRRIKSLLRDRWLNQGHGGMIFTSQRAVEGFAKVVGDLEQEERTGRDESRIPSASVVYTLAGDFPLYVVGPATERTLGDLVEKSTLLATLRCKILGRETGNGQSLAYFILKHYNHTHYRDYFEIYEAPRLPFVPLVGNRSEQYPRLEKGDHRLKKRPLLFLVGETRRDVIPRTLMDERLGERRIEVEEVEVYKTGVMTGFEDDFRSQLRHLGEQGHQTIVVVVFSPTGCEVMLDVLGNLDDQKSWHGFKPAYAGGKCVVVSIGPTTRDYLRSEFKFEVDVCAQSPSPQGISEGVNALLRERGVP